MKSWTRDHFGSIATALYIYNTLWYIYELLWFVTLLLRYFHSTKH